MYNIIKDAEITPRIITLSLGALLLGWAGSSNAQIPWYSGQRAYGQVTIEPAVDDATGEEIFLHTPDHAPLPSNAAQRAHAPMYLVLYPASSTIVDKFLDRLGNDHVTVVIEPIDQRTYGAVFQILHHGRVVERPQQRSAFVEHLKKLFVIDLEPERLCRGMEFDSIDEQRNLAPAI